MTARARVQAGEGKRVGKKESQVGSGLSSAEPVAGLALRNGEIMT